MTIRTRFAPSPTGYLHVGGARTALFSYAFARKYGGKFVLRIEDTDLERSTPESINAILEGLAWLGLEYDEGPFFQTQRFARYNEVIDQLLAQNLAYRCDCSKERLDSIREQQKLQKLKTRYDGHCRQRQINSNLPHVIRLRNPDNGIVSVHDLIHGQVHFNNEELDDLILRRSDGSPTYNLSVVVDDIDMRITHVIRGDDHLNNTPRQINILNALGHKPPYYAHVPMILGDDGTRLSKRHGAVSVLAYKEAGFLPEAMLNYLIRLGWSHGDQEIFSLQDIISLFDINQVHRSPAAFNSSKLLWLNQQYLMQAEPARIAKLLPSHLEKLAVDYTHGADLIEVIKLQQSRSNTLVELAQISAFFYQDFADYDTASAKKHLRAEAYAPLSSVRDKLAQLTDWSPIAIHKIVEQVATNLNLKLGKIAQPLRVAIVGRAASPGIDVTLHLVGQATCLKRIDRALAYINSGE
jgi:glutamyl-tRNA synthetase